MTALAKDSRLHIRCDQEVRHLLDKAASYTRMSVSEFILRNAVDQAKSVVKEHESITLSLSDFDRFLVALDQPAQPNAALKRAFALHAEQAN